LPAIFNPFYSPLLLQSIKKITIDTVEFIELTYQSGLSYMNIIADFVSINNIALDDIGYY